MIPKELEEILRRDEDAINLRITKTALAEENLIIDFTSNTDTYPETISQLWTITAIQHKKNRLTDSGAYSIQITSDDPLLWQFNDVGCELYFTGQCLDVPKLFYQVYHTHKRLFGNFQPLDIPSLEERHNTKPLPYSGGLLAKGPKKLMEQYAECLLQNGMDYSIVGEWPAGYWNGQQFVPEPKDLKILFMGDSYIIAKDFLFQKNAEERFVYDT